MNQVYSDFEDDEPVYTPNKAIHKKKSLISYFFNEFTNNAKVFDFGNGPVPAHQHPNGGGWVADTAHVADTAYVGPDAQVFGSAQVSGSARVYGRARVSGDTVMT